MAEVWSPNLLEAAEAAMWEDWAAAPEGPDQYLLGPAVLRRGQALAFGFGALRRERLFNRAVNCHTAPEAAAFLSFFRDRGLPPALDLVPSAAGELSSWLAQEGFRQILQLSVLVQNLPEVSPRNSRLLLAPVGSAAPLVRHDPPGAGLPQRPIRPAPPPPPIGMGPVRPQGRRLPPSWPGASWDQGGMAPDRSQGAGGVLVELAGPGQAALFAATYAAGFGVSTADILLYRALGTAVVGRPGWRACLAWYGGEPAGAALLYCAGPVAVLAGCGVRPQLRRRGVQAALVRYRLLAAARAGCRLAVTQTGVGSPSERNMLRLGFSLAYRKSIWGL